QGCGGIERMYRRVCVVDLVSACASECAYCVRGYYDTFAMSESQMDRVAQSAASDPYLKEVLITGGDPLIAEKKLTYLMSRLSELAPNIQFIRIGTRMPVQDPQRITESLAAFFASLRGRFQIELACQINHSVELQKPTLA